MAGLFPRPPATDIGGVGKERHHLPAAGAHPYKRDLKTIEFHLLDTGHFALEEDGEEIAGLIRRFLSKHID